MASLSLLSTETIAVCQMPTEGRALKTGLIPEW